MRTIHGSSIHEASAHIGSNWSSFSKSKIQWYNSCLVNLYWNVLQAPYSHAVIYRRKHVTQPLPVWVQYQYRKSVNLVIARVSMISLSIIQSPHSLLGCKISNLTKFSYQQTRCHAHHWTYFGISVGGSLFSTKEDSNYLYHPSVDKWYKIQIHVFYFPQHKIK